MDASKWAWWTATGLGIAGGILALADRIRPRDRALPYVEPVFRPSADGWMLDLLNVGDGAAVNAVLAYGFRRKSRLGFRRDMWVRKVRIPVIPADGTVHVPVWLGPAAAVALIYQTRDRRTWFTCTNLGRDGFTRTGSRGAWVRAVPVPELTAQEVEALGAERRATEDRMTAHRNELPWWRWGWMRFWWWVRDLRDRRRERG